MRIKTIVVAAAALFAALSSQAAEAWFSVGFDPSSPWPGNFSDWSNTDNASFENGVLKLDNANELTYTAEEKQLVSTKIATVTTTMKFTAYEEVPAVLDESKAGVIVMETGSGLAYYGLAKVGSANTWVQLTGATPTVDEAVDVYMLLKGDKVQYKIGNTVLTYNSESWLDVVSNGTVSEMVYCGTGEISYLSGEIDNAPVEVALKWPAGYTAVSYQIGENASVPISGASPYTVNKNLAAGDVVTFTFENADGATKTLTAIAGTNDEIDASDATFVWADYLGEAVNGAYTIDDANDLDMLRKGVASELKTTGVTFKQTANIDMSTAGAFAGIGTYNAIPTAGTPFSGTYDGGNFKICNVDFTQRNYGGVFNQVNGGTIKNLTVSNITCSAFSASVNNGEWGGAIVGNIGNGATLQNLVAEGTFAADHPATHNVAGIVIRACGGGENGTLIKDCTNNATLYGAYTKIGGICAIAQHKIDGGAVTFDGCANNGDIVSSRPTDGVTGYAGILGYANENTVLANCSNTGSIVNNSGANTDKDGGLVGYTYSHSITDNGGNSAPSDKKMIGTWGNATETGFLYATVENDIATTITGAPVAGGEYLLEGNAAPVIELDDGDTVAFDTALGYTLDDTGITAAEGLEVTSATVGTVTTYATAEAIRLSDNALELNYNCKAEISVLGAPEGSTFYWTEQVVPGESISAGDYTISGDTKPLKLSSGRTAATVKFYSEAISGTYTLTVAVTNENVEVAQLVANVTIKDVAAVVDDTEYAYADFNDAYADAIANDKVLGIYRSAPAVSLAAGESLQVKVLATRSVVNLPTVTGPAGTDGTVYVVNKVKDSATGITTFSLTAETPSVMFTSADGETTNYFDASFKATAAGTYKLLKNITRSQLSVGTTGVVLDLNGKTFTSTATGTTAAINVASTIGTASLKIMDSSEGGEGAIVAPNYSAVQAGKNGSVEIESGSFSGKTVIVYTVSGGTVAISGGSFAMVSGSASSMLNCKDDNRGTITVTGGSFNGFDPATSNAADGDMVADGYESKLVGGCYVVSEVAGGFPGGKDGKTFTIDPAVQTALEEKLAGKALTETVEGTTSGLTYAQAYALGLFDEKTGTVEDIKPTIEIKDGKVVVSLDATAKTGYKVMLNVYQKASLTAQWPTEPTKSYELDSAAEAVGFDPSAGGSGFYKVGVTIEDAE